MFYIIYVIYHILQILTVKSAFFIKTYYIYFMIFRKLFIHVFTTSLSLHSCQGLAITVISGWNDAICVTLCVPTKPGIASSKSCQGKKLFNMTCLSDKFCGSS